MDGEPSMDTECNIFASPPEPLFNLRGHHLGENLVKDVFSTLVYQSRMKDEQLTHFSHAKIAACVLLICDQFQQQQETRYIAIQLVEKFLNMKCRQHYKKLATSQLKNHSKILEWKKFANSLQGKGFTYILICVQLASKVCSHHKVMSIGKSIRFLSRASEKVTAGQMMRYELEVLETINYEFPITSPLTFLEAVLEILGSKRDLLFSVKSVHNICLKLLDLAYLERRVIYDRLFQVAVGGRCTPSRRAKFVMVENDDLLLATSIIEAASYLSNNDADGKVLSHLSSITQIPSEDIMDLATVLAETVVGR